MVESTPTMLLVLCLVFSIFTLVFGNVPVLLFESYQSNKQTDFPALSKISSDVFGEYLLKKVQGQEPSPVLAIFLTETLSAEDFSFKDSMNNGYFPKLDNITGSAAGVEYIPSVESPLDAVQKFDKYGYKAQDFDETNLPKEGGSLFLIKLQNANDDEDRPELLRRQDDKITAIYSELLAHYSHVIAVFTGKCSSWVEPEKVTRLKRDVKAIDTPIYWSTGSSGLQVLLYSGTIPTYYDGVNIIDISRYTPSSITKDYSKGILKLNVVLKRVELENLNFVFTFSNTSSYWNLDVVTVTSSNDTAGITLLPLTDVYAPLNMSYHSSIPTQFYSNSSTKGVKAMLTFADIQIEPFFDEAGTNTTAFHDAVDSITFFTIPIWSGIFTVTILAIIIIWGITMIMDIRTMDQFDDPKGKTITVTTTE